MAERCPVRVALPRSHGCRQGAGSALRTGLRSPTEGRSCCTGCSRQRRSPTARAHPRRRPSGSTGRVGRCAVKPTAAGRSWPAARSPRQVLARPPPGQFHRPRRGPWKHRVTMPWTVRAGPATVLAHDTDGGRFLPEEPLDRRHSRSFGHDRATALGIFTAGVCRPRCSIRGLSGSDANLLITDPNPYRSPAGWGAYAGNSSTKFSSWTNATCAMS